MKSGILIGAGLLVLVLALACTAGVISVRTADTHNTTVAVMSYNSWVSIQTEFNHDVQAAVMRIDEHVQVYNTEIAQDKPDYALLQSNLAEDRQLLGRLESGLDNLSAATDRFDQGVAVLTYHNASEKRVKESLDLMSQSMKAYVTEMGNARQHLIAYVDTAGIYIQPDDPDYWNDKYRQQAMQAKDRAQQSLAEGDLVLGNLSVQARKLGDLQ